jgi:uncharacterized membrane protein
MRIYIYYIYILKFYCLYKPIYIYILYIYATTHTQKKTPLLSSTYVLHSFGMFFGGLPLTVRCLRS